ncbi:MAG: hypothetical protein ABIH86_00195 [Planctomycetota bacterium]
MDDGAFARLINEFRDSVAEVFFPWTTTPSGRAALTGSRGRINWGAQERLEADLVALRQSGVKLDLVLNANCHGDYALSKRLANETLSIIDRIDTVAGGVDILTTASPVIAEFIKKIAPSIEMRASVNMRIGTVKGMEYIAEFFDSFHIQREQNRDLNRIADLKRWADANGKRLIILLNSGCMRDCSVQTFHDNCVAHERGIDEIDRIPGATPSRCRVFLKDKTRWVSILQNTWIRPEDVRYIEPFFSIGKLATRMHDSPRLVLEAYASRRYHGNLVDLCEPGYSSILAPYIIDNDRFPDDWFQRTTDCDKRCGDCDYCRRVLKDVLVRIDE